MFHWIMGSPGPQVDQSFCRKTSTKQFDFDHIHDNNTFKRIQISKIKKLQLVHLEMVEIGTIQIGSIV